MVCGKTFMCSWCIGTDADAVGVSIGVILLIVGAVSLTALILM